MNKKTIYLLGCSFTDNVRGYLNEFFTKFKEDYNVINLAYPSRSNFQILEDIKLLPTDSKVIIQWSALTRPSGNPDYDIDWNIELNNLAFSDNDPLNFLINNFIKIVKRSNNILVEKNIKSFQYIGWVQWNDNELDCKIKEELLSLPITWFNTPSLTDVMPVTCWSYDCGTLNSKINQLDNKLDLWEWYPISWGGMSEWIRFNVNDELKRYKSIRQFDGYDDPHPTEYSSEYFYKSIILPEINKLFL